MFLLATLLFFAITAQGQATRTWVSGMGDDVNPCSRTAPCKTYQGAIGKTGPGGIISALDAGAFGAVTITKSITIEGTGTLAASMHGNWSGIVINAAPTDVVVLRDLTLHGAGTAPNGVRVLQAGQVFIQHCNIQNNAGDGIVIAPSGASIVTEVFVQDSRVVNNAGIGINVLPTGENATATLTVEASTVSGNGSNGLYLAGMNNSAAIYASRFTHNGLNGLHVQHASSTMFVESSLVAYNHTGITAGLGAQKPVIHLSRCMIVGNKTNGIAGSGTVVGFSNNAITGNGGTNTVSQSVAAQ